MFSLFYLRFLAAGGKDDSPRRRLATSSHTRADVPALTAGIKPASPPCASVSSVVSLVFLPRRQGRSEDQLLVRNHAPHFALVPVAHQRGRSQIPFAFLALRRQDVPQVRSPPLYLPRPGYLEALGSALVRFQFRHRSPQKQPSVLGR
jgi:hypothetical protein